MRLKNLKNIEEFIEVVNCCEGDVFLTDWLADDNDEHDILLNLKSPLCLFIGISKLLSDYGDWFEIRCTKKQDEQLFLKFIDDRVST